MRRRKGVNAQRLALILAWCGYSIVGFYPDQEESVVLDERSIEARRFDRLVLEREGIYSFQEIPTHA